MLGTFCFERSLVLYLINIVHNSAHQPLLIWTWGVESGASCGMTTWTWTLCHSTPHCNLVHYLNAIYCIHNTQWSTFRWDYYTQQQISKLWGRAVRLLWKIDVFCQHKLHANDLKVCNCVFRVVNYCGTVWYRMVSD